jgi:copper chaperone
MPHPNFQPNLLTILQPPNIGTHMQNLLLKITGLQDEQSVRTLANAIQDLPNIGHLEISLEKGEASVEHGRFVSPEDILQAVVDAGFEAELAAEPQAAGAKKPARGRFLRG